jgi:hypothetical protein
MARRGVDEREEPNPLYAAAAIMFDVGIIVGAHKMAAIANAVQKKLASCYSYRMRWKSMSSP